MLPLPYGCVMALIALVGTICNAVVASLRFSLQTEAIPRGRSFKAPVCCEDMTYWHAPDFLAPIGNIPSMASTEMRFARSFSVKMSRILLHPARLARRTLYSPFLATRTSLSYRSAVSSQDLATAPAKGIATSRVIPISRINFLPWARSHGRWKTPTQRTFVFVMIVHPFLFRDDNAVFVDVFCPLSFSPAFSSHEMCRGNIKLISEGNAIQTERSLLLALECLIVLSPTRLMSGLLLNSKNAVAGYQFSWCDTEADLVVQVICGVQET